MATNDWPIVTTGGHKNISLDLGVDPSKSTGVDLGLPSRVELVYLAAVDPPSILFFEVT